MGFSWLYSSTRKHVLATTAKLGFIYARVREMYIGKEGYKALLVFGGTGKGHGSIAQLYQMWWLHCRLGRIGRLLGKGRWLSHKSKDWIDGIQR